MLDSHRMRIPADAEIAAEKLTHYLLVPRPWDDKAKFLAQAGFDRERPETLLHAIRELAAQGDALSDGRTSTASSSGSMAYWLGRTAGGSPSQQSGSASTSTVPCGS
jgi:hypothetical protein